ncbi:MAG: hypothetical protein L0332_16870 [Chloroflexi bacterium]|nr:hypothetical protein [Chloroflexota bacterium]MCI0575382.1 hypothetical protein [Chloroflexota bacterium]MCI0646370.1 hypothetical protein [Chloroflexota bacterium]MCI0728372.1 hypothetical protein [Chloroflexota bacterium]
MELQAITGQLYIVNGQPQDTESVPGLLAQKAPSRAAHGRDRDFLFAHLTLSGPPAETAVLAQDLLDSISNLFYQTPGSVTAALRRAIIETNRLLLQHNVSGANVAREGAITCAVLRGEELYIAQAGETFAFVGHNFGVERLPPNDPPRITPMGRTAGLDIRFFHNWLQPGNMFLLADPRLAHLPTRAFNNILIGAEIENSLRELSEIIGQDSARVLVLEFTDEAPDYVPDATRPSAAAVSLPATRPSGQRLSPPTGRPQRDLEPARPVAARSMPFVPRRLPPAVANLDVETVETTARKTTAQAAKGLSRFTGWLAQLLDRLRPGRPAPGEYTGWAIPAILAILIPLIVTVAVTTVFLQRGRIVRVAEIRQEMNQNLTLAQAATTREEEQNHYFRVLALADYAESLQPGNEEINRLRREAQKELDTLEGITRLVVQPLYEYPEGTLLTSIALGDELNGGIFLLDAAGNRVYRHETDETYLNLTTLDPELILSGSDVVGNHVVGQLIDLMWRPRGQAVSRDGMAVLDSNGALVTYYPNLGDVRAVRLGLASDWRQPVAITSFNERLYILDSGSEQIWRYFAEGDGFTINDEQRSLTFGDSGDLDQAADLAIYSEDGSVILAYRDGRLRRYVGDRLLWNEAEFLTSDTDSPPIVPMQAPTAVKIAGQGLNSSIYVLDPSTGRLLYLSLGGGFLGQFKATDTTGQELFARAADFAVAENPLRVFIVADNTLYVATQQ